MFVIVDTKQHLTKIVIIAGFLLLLALGSLQISRAQQDNPANITQDEAVDASQSDISESSSSTFYLPLIIGNADGDAALESEHEQSENGVIESAVTSGMIDIRVAASRDDAEESATGSVTSGSSDLELVDDASDNQTVGIRFRQSSKR